MHMVWHNFQAEDFGTRLSRDLGDNHFQSFGYLARENLPAVLWAKDYVVLAGVRDVIVDFVCRRHSALYHTAQNNAITHAASMKIKEIIAFGTPIKP